MPEWAEQSLELDPSWGAILQTVVTVRIAVGAMAAAVETSPCRSLDVLPVGVAMGAATVLTVFYTEHTISEITFHISRMKLPLYMVIVCLFLMIVDVILGFFVASMNVPLQRHGYVLLSADRSIVVQNFNENVSVLLMLCLYALLIRFSVSVGMVIVSFGIFVYPTMALVICQRRVNEKLFHTATFIGEDEHH